MSWTWSLPAPLPAETTRWWSLKLSLFFTPKTGLVPSAPGRRGPDPKGRHHHHPTGPDPRAGPRVQSPREREVLCQTRSTAAYSSRCATRI